MANALDFVLETQRQKQQSEETQAAMVSNMFKGIMDSVSENKRFERDLVGDVLKQSLKPKSLTDQLIELGKVREVATTSRNLPLMNRIDQAIGGLVGGGVNVNDFVGQGQTSQVSSPQPVDSSIPQVNFETDPFTGKLTPRGELQKTAAEKEILGPLDRKKLEQEKIRQEQKTESLRQEGLDTLDAIQKAKDGSKFFGAFGDLPSRLVPSSLTGEFAERSLWEANINKILSGRVIEVMTKMKEASKTGATGFGQLSEKELQVLKTASTTLNRNLAPKDALDALEKMEKIQKKALGIKDDGSSNKPSKKSTNKQRTFKTPEEADASGLPKGTVVLVGKRRYQI